MAQQQRVLVVVGTRPEAIKLAPVIHALQREPWAELRVLATAQHREMLDQVHTFFGIRPDRDLDLMRPEQSLADLTARMAAAMDPVLGDEHPALVLAQGDTTTVMVTALCCFYRRIAFGHVEAGLRTHDFDNPFPEEMNRVLVGRIARLHFAPTDGARQNLLREGVDAASVHVTGNTGIDALLWAASRVDANAFVPPKHLVLVTAHRRENLGAPLANVCDALRRLAARGDVQVLFAMHPNPAVRDVVRRELDGQAAVRLCEQLDYPAMVAAMRASTLILTDSGGVQEEAPSLGKPVLVLRTATERPEGVAAGTSVLVGTDAARIVAAAGRLLDDPAARAAMTTATNPYGDGHAAGRIVAACRTFLGA